MVHKVTQDAVYEELLDASGPMSSVEIAGALDRKGYTSYDNRTHQVIGYVQVMSVINMLGRLRKKDLVELTNGSLRWQVKSCVDDYEGVL